MLKDKRERKHMAAVKAAVTLAITAATAIAPFAVRGASFAEVGVIYEKTEKQTITQGVTLENIVKFTDDGWYNIYVMEVDLANKYLNVDTLTNAESVGKLASAKKMAVQRNAVAAVNASFFTPTGSGNGFPVGTVIQSGSILCATADINRYSDSMASLSLNKLNEVLLDYWKVDMSLVSGTGAKISVDQYNKTNGAKYTGISVFDRKWGAAAVGATADMPDIQHMVVVDGIVTQFLSGQSSVPIPENGFVVVTRTEGAKKLKQAFSPGDKAMFNIASAPNWTNLKMSVSGSSILVRNGAIPAAFSFAPANVTARSPKTAIGVSKDGKKLYMVTVDGRQTASIGMTLKDMALFMQSIGAYNAISMDGGGSTTMVARPLGSRDVRIMNNPCDGIARSISTAIGIFTSAPAAPLAGMVIETKDRFMFTNATREFTIKGYDKYNNPIDVDLSKVKWSVSGVKGTFKGNVFRPSTYGEGKITAKIGNVSASINISVLSKPAVIILDQSSIKLPVGQKKTFKVKGINPRGYTATIEPANLTWKLSSKIGEFKDGVLTATKRGAAYIDASFAGAHAYCTLSVSDDKSSVADMFESVNGVFQSYPETIKGSYSISNEQKVSGKASGKLVYDFTTNTDVSRAAYMVLPNGGLTLDKDISKIGLQVYNDHENSGWLRAELTDADGAKQVVDLARTMDWTGWKYTEASIGHIKLPAKLRRIYIVQVNPDADAGILYFDDLTLTVSGYPSVDGLKVPENTPFVDEANKAVPFGKATADSFRFGVLGQSRKPANDVEKKLASIFATKVDKYLELGSVVGTGSHESVTGLVKKKPVIATHTVDLKSTKGVDYKYSVTDFKNSRFIKLDTRKNSLRTSDPEQWKRFLDDLASFKGKNVFILMDQSPETFTDKLELELFKKTLSDYRFDTLRNVWVFYKGNKNESRMENGVKYIETAGYEVEGLKPGKTGAAKYVLVTVKGSTVTYIYKEIDS
ncbi:MAG: phosphodiester glycosidase family protein [Bacillota bacterium]